MYQLPTGCLLITQMYIMTKYQFNIVLDSLNNENESIKFIMVSCGLSRYIATLLYTNLNYEYDVYSKLPLLIKHHVSEFTQFILDVKVNFKYKLL